jgi:hypothetical protein
LEPLGAEQAILGDIREQRAAGSTLQAIADELNRAGSRTRAGSPWRFEYVRWWLAIPFALVTIILAMNVYYRLLIYVACGPRIRRSF